jgi:methylated-DNA-[protein]-cysteine S-methyltransferase
MQEGRTTLAVRPGWQPASEPFEDARVQLAEYFAGRRRRFDLPLAMTGTPFQRRVWRALRDIPYGQTTSYGELARRIGRSPAASRAVGMANGRNPLAVVVPCHRVIGADGTLTGFGGGLERKRLLLELEAATLAGASGRG